MKGRADYAIFRRVIDLYFELMFTNEKEDLYEENHVYLKKVETMHFHEGFQRNSPDLFS